MTDSELATYRLTHKCATLQQIGNIFGLSRERVRQRLKRAGVETKHFRFVQKYKCNECGKESHLKLFCSNECRSKYASIQLECSQCHKIFTRKIYRAFRTLVVRGSQLTFCDKHCQGVYLAEHFGFKVHPENIICNK
jgi:hypothetical protein